MKRNDNVTDFPKFININIGVVIFVIIFIYLLFNVFTYFTSVHIPVYEVEQGTIASNNIYKGLVLREEVVYSSEYRGDINYYIKEYTKVGFHDLICTIDENGNVSEKLNEAKKDLAVAGAKVSEEMTEVMNQFQLNYDGQDFYQTYAWKEEMNSLLNESLSLDALEQINDYANTAEGNQSFHKIRANRDGIIAYYIDGFETVQVDDFQLEMLDESGYERKKLSSFASTSVNDAIYKMVLSEQWNVLLPIPEGVAKELLEELEIDNYLRIRFLKDKKEMYAEYEIKEKDGNYYAVLSFTNGMIRYINDRFLDIELLLQEETGLKIPNTAIVEKDFFAIPNSYFIKEGDTNNLALLIEKTNSDGKTTPEYIHPTIYYNTEEVSYIDGEFVSAEDIIIKEDSLERYTVGNQIATLQGVYNINKGYAVFKQIEIVLQNEEYSIIKLGTSYGISLYDHIALDGSKIMEDELLK